MGEFQVVVFNLNNQVCGVDTSQVQEIIRFQDVAKVSDMPEFVDGTINLRGKVVPVINLNKRFGLGETEITRKTKILITQANENLLGFIVNDVSEITSFSEDDIEPVPDLVLNNLNMYLKSIGKKGDVLIPILDLSNILKDSEIRKLDMLYA